MAEAIRLSKILLSHFERGSLAIHPQLEESVPLNCYTSIGVTSIRGTLNLSHHETRTRATAQCSLYVGSNWRQGNPALRCTEDWVRRPGGSMNADWHINSDGSLCYVIRDEWMDQLHFVETQHGEELAMEVAAFYAINNTRWLLFHHLEAYRRKVSRWPAEWPQWAHGLAGVNAYHRGLDKELRSRFKRNEALEVAH